jgi:hypothetical protein
MALKKSTNPARAATIKRNVSIFFIFPYVPNGVPLNVF